jgi:isoaspartyl peptidase/L-asparaginase-like protein (Ntn-hydrolase superfamily)
MVAIDSAGNIAAGTSTNGANHKIPGRVGDSPIPGSGGYADNSVGAAAATGDGDILMRFLPSMLAVEFMRNGMSPDEAGQRAMERISKHYPKFMGGIVVVDKNGNYGAACHGIDSFPFSIYHSRLNQVKVETRKCTISM